MMEVSHYMKHSSWIGTQQLNTYNCYTVTLHIVQ